MDLIGNPGKSAPSLLIIQRPGILTQRDSVLTRYLANSSAFSRIVVILPENSIRVASYETLGRSVLIRLPLRVPTLVDSLSQRGVSTSPLMWMELMLRARSVLGNSTFDICWVGTNLTLASLGGILKRMGLYKKLVYDDADFFPSCYTSAPIRILMYLLESFVVQNADLMISISYVLGRIRKKQGASMVRVVPHGVEYKVFRRAYELRLRRIVESGYDPQRMLFAGNYDLILNDVTLCALEKVKEAFPDFRLRIVGTGNARRMRRFLARARDIGIGEIIEQAGFVPYSRLVEEFASADIALAKLFGRNDLLWYGTQQKVIQYLAAGLPVLASPSFAGRLVVDSGTGFVTLPTPLGIASTIVTMLRQSKDEYLLMSRRATELASRFDWEVLAKEYASLLASIGK